MALRQKLSQPGFEWRLQQQLATVRALRPARNVEFRRGADPAAVVEDILPYNHVKLCAPVGSGKSVKIPSALALTTKAIVFHVVPSRQLAAHLFAYLVKLSQAEGGHKLAPIELFRGSVDEIPRNGVFFLSAADMVDIMVRHGDMRKFMGCTVFLDEAHESDAYTHVVRTVALQMGAERLVLASATFEPKVHGMRSTPGAVVMKPVELGPYNTWEVDRVGSPFHMATLRDGILVFVDSRAAASALAVAYERAGADVFRLTASSSEAEVAAAMRCATDQRGGLFAILADYTYRSGFTFPVSRVVDVGTVAYYDPQPGQFRRLNRRMFAFEKEQAAGRVGRVSGDAEYYYEKGPCQEVMCDLEGVEMEAAAFIYRCMGFCPTAELSSAYMATHSLPDGVSIRSALNGPYPLTYYAINKDSAAGLPANEQPSNVKAAKQLAGERARPVGEVTRNFASPPPSYRVSNDSAGTRDSSVDSRLAGKRDSGYSSDDKKSPAMSAGEWDDMIDEFAGKSIGVELEDGNYYVTQVRNASRKGVVATMTFPAGLQSVREFARRKNFEFAVRSLAREDRAWAFSSLLDRYNTVTAQIRGAKEAVRLLTSKQRGNGFLERMKDVMEELSADHADAVACLRAAEIFAMSPTWVSRYDGELKAETAARDGYVKQFTEVLNVRGGDDLDSDICSGVEDRLRQGGEYQVARGRGRDSHDSKGYELLLPSWMGGKRLTYDLDTSESKGSRNMQVMQREYGHDDKYRYTVTRRYTRVTTWR